MNHLARLATIAPLALSLSGCVLYFGDDDDDCTTYYGGGAPAQNLRNPETGQCEYVGGYPPEPGYCGDVPAAAREGLTAVELTPLPQQDWASCYDSCDGLPEDICRATPACRAVYVDTCPPNADCAGPGLVFTACWGTAPSGPVQGGGCAGLDAYACSLHDDCQAVHKPVACAEPSCRGLGGFAYCRDEEATPRGCYGDGECDPGQVCNASEVCLPPPGCDPAKGACPAVCYGFCVTEPAPPPPPPCEELQTEPLCVERADCTPIYEGVGCTCDENACVCEEWLFLQCEPVAVPL